MEMTTTTMARTIEAEARAVEAGHRAFVQEDGSIRVASDTYTGKGYRVTFGAMADGRIVFECRPAYGSDLFHNDHGVVSSRIPGSCPCLHSASAARRLSRESLARFDAERGWVANVDRVVALTAPAKSDESDPFAGLV